MIPQTTVDLILDTARIEDVVGDYVTLRRRGASFVACCPFHNEKTPSFYVTPSKGIYKCFGCGKAGSAVGFVMEQEHCTYVEALRYLARKYNIEIQEKEETAEEIANRQHTESLMLVSEFAQKFFEQQLETPDGHATGYAYLRSRGIDDETMKQFGLGWAPAGRSSLADAALAAGYKSEYLIETGLCVKYDDGHLADRFRERAMFPIHSLSGRVIAYSGRTLRSDGSIAKYVNSPETPIYVKSRALYGIALAKSEIARKGRCLLAEGNVDVVSLHQLGIRNVVASCGTALTVEQIRIIHKFTEHIVIMYDGDAAGIHAAVRAIGLILQEGMNVSLLLFPDGDDPDSFARKHTLAEFEEFINTHEQDFVSYMTAVTQLDVRDPLKRAELINSIADTISVIPDAVKRSVYVDSASQRLSIDSKVLFERIRATRQRAKEEEFAARERAQRRARAGLPEEETDAPAGSLDVPGGDYTGAEATVPPPPVQTQPTGMAALIVNKTLGPVEMDLMYFILHYGTEVLDFESDSDFYSGDESDKPTVSDFIRASLEDDEASFANPALRDTYDAYMRLYDEGWQQDEIIRALLNGADRTVAFVTAELSMDHHQLTVRNFRDSLTTTASWLTFYVPRTMLLYADKRVEDRLNTLRTSLKGADPEEQMNTMKEMIALQGVQKTIKEKLKERNN